MTELEEKSPPDHSPEQMETTEPPALAEEAAPLPVESQPDDAIPDEPPPLAEEPGSSSEAAGQEKSAASLSWLLLIIGLIAGGLAGFFGRPLLMPGETSAAPLANVEASDQMNVPDPHQAVMLAVIAGARHFNGDPNAPVTLVEFGDFNCGYCSRWAAETLPKIQEKYIKTGKVRMAYVHFPILGPDSITAAEGTECAAQQDKFWEYHNILYAHTGTGFTPENLATLAGEIGMDKTVFTNCLANFADQKSLEDDYRLAQVMGVRGTPAFLVNGVALAGAYPYENFEEIIESELSLRQPQPAESTGEPGG
jgi:protein-disulfide isomerase